MPTMMAIVAPGTAIHNIFTLEHMLLTPTITKQSEFQFNMAPVMPPHQKPTTELLNAYKVT